MRYKRLIEVLRDINSYFWNAKVFNGANIRKYSNDEGINPIHFEIQIWIYDTLKILQDFSSLDLFFKGGTCIQTYLPLEYQRFSIDLDFNIQSEDRTKEFLLRKIGELNEELDNKGLLIPVLNTKYIKLSSDNMVYGEFYPKEYDSYSGTITFYRLLMSKVLGKYRVFTYRNDLKKPNRVRGIFNHLLLQVNIRHQPPALKSELKDIKLRIQKYPEYKTDFKFKCLSLGDLFADKLIAYKNRKAFKDLYDLGMMARILKDSDFEICRQKIKLFSQSDRLIQDVVKTIEGSLNDKEYKRYLFALPRDVAPIISDRMFYTGLISVVKDF
jgi:predicted nucleotidyltransferase component of viral defense system